MGIRRKRTGQTSNHFEMGYAFEAGRRPWQEKSMGFDPCKVTNDDWSADS